MKFTFIQEKIMRVPYGVNKEYFRYSLFLVFCNRITTSAVSAGLLLARKKAVDPVAPVYKYCLISVSNMLTTTCQYEALKYVSFPVQTLAKCTKMIPVMVATVSQFFISYTIRTFGALTFAAIMTSRQVIVFGSSYTKNIFKKLSTKTNTERSFESHQRDVNYGTPLEVKHKNALCYVVKRN
ncbi:hypothetical protein V6N12_039664 [Hibiscus sabdariffa]|uniref:Sugar phosphate transporter domain-containing protein n=1 Tax=Hibiscus sabdariffa TaxID=183260 RepID=A0ABR2E2N5_9ROSI